ncbi:putative membrane protein [Salsuginibacillus halophilus]|uniref:Putative membrane protein n=1 Tax=Salsuginibacillus halophilus TaxID=517424 RepID=A0A2P8HQK3_9BACI|nr:DUF2254 domain-containing protein [Salsuginibacillus halophilus]PSL48499.1 putative membrane protein [Salsuginibacillus halophilus]
MSRRQLWYELRTNLWFSSVIYALFALLIVYSAYWLDFNTNISAVMPETLLINYEFFYTVISTLLASVITLNAFTFNSTLVILTTFSGQFSPRLLLNFINDHRTQHVLGIFNATFVVMITAFFIVNEAVQETYVMLPLLTFSMMFLAMANFVYFINHAVKWMQVPTLAFNMKMESRDKIMKMLGEDLEPYRIREPDKNVEELSSKDANTIYADKTGFLQIIDFKKLIKRASKDDVILRLEVRVGDFVVKGTPILLYWIKEGERINESSYRNFLYFGHKKTEIQDLEFGLNKLKEIAIKSIGNNDPDTAKNVVYQLTDLLLDIATITKFTPYLANEDNELRLIIPDESFDYYLNTAFAHIVYYAKDDPIIMNDIVEGLALLAKSLETSDMKCCWKFTEAMIRAHTPKHSFTYENKRLHSRLREIAVMTDEVEAYNELIDDIKIG